MKRGDKKMEKIIAGLVQMDSGPDMNENMRMAEQYVREAAEQGAKLILFPETAEYTGADMPGHASAVPGYVSRRFSSLAKRYGVYLHGAIRGVRPTRRFCSDQMEKRLQNTAKYICLM